MADPGFQSIATFSIVARDPGTGDLGVAVQSKFPAVGSVVPWARAEAGAVATQAFGNPAYGPAGLDLMERGLTAEEALRVLLREDEDRDHRQVGLVDRAGEVAAHTGTRCMDWAGHRLGEGFTVQGNILAGEDVVGDMARAYREAKDRALAERLLLALEAGQVAGGDRRGMQSAALLVVREGGGYAGLSDVWIDLRVDDHPRPIQELRRLLGVHTLYLGKTVVEDLQPVDEEIAAFLERLLSRRGYPVEVDGKWSEEDSAAFEELLGVENLEMRHVKGSRIDPVVLDYFRKQGRDGS